VTERFRTSGERLDDFAGEVLVVRPRREELVR
jgi:hypothetical protein